ncbi:MAG: UDP-N-acetylmuramoyl-L-alanine--D-glutamate ligase [Balneolaceae bacterium]|nr:MAG: UDP-N-acetylmuramoyl-L-alanine--D-glutamate ligase [Balneolaceae bacterium]
MDVKGKHIVIIGGARSGVAAACLLKHKGATVFVTDSGPIPDVSLARLEREGIDFEQGGHSGRAESGDFAVISPGVPSDAPLTLAWLGSGRNVYSEIEVSWWFSDSPLIAITGSNGKTTTTTWVHHLWQTAGLSCRLGGNIGIAYADLVDQPIAGEVIALEVSSFQLDHIDRFRPRVAMILNITPDHLNRYSNKFENYTASKLRIYENQGPDDYLIYNFDDPVLKKHIEVLSRLDSCPKLLGFSDQNEVPAGAFVRDDKIIFKMDNKEDFLMNVGDIGLRGRHNLNNGLATALAARAFEIRNEVIRDSLMQFEGVEHRLEQVRIVRGVRYINDSKATNVNAVWYALKSFNEPVVLILGGRDKGNDYSEIAGEVQSKVHTIIAIGEGRQEIERQLGNEAPYMLTAESMEEAVAIASKKARRGEVVLLSPACASFDMFNSYEHRGQVFKEAVRKIS